MGSKTIEISGELLREFISLPKSVYFKSASWNGHNLILTLSSENFTGDRRDCEYYVCHKGTEVDPNKVYCEQIGDVKFDSDGNYIKDE